MQLEGDFFFVSLKPYTHIVTCGFFLTDCFNSKLCIAQKTGKELAFELIVFYQENILNFKFKSLHIYRKKQCKGVSV